MPYKPLNYAIPILHILQSHDVAFALYLAVSEVFYDDEHHRDEEDTEDGGNGRTEDDGNAHGDSV